MLRMGSRTMFSDRFCPCKDEVGVSQSSSGLACEIGLAAVKLVVTGKAVNSAGWLGLAC